MGEPYSVKMTKDYKSEALGLDLKAGESFNASHGLAQMLADMGLATIHSLLDEDEDEDV